MLVHFMKIESFLVRTAAADGLIFSTSPSSCCTLYVSVLQRRDTEEIHIWKMMPWMVTHKDFKPHTNLLPTLWQTNALVPPLPSRRRERASRTISISFDSIHDKMEGRTLLHHTITQVMLQYLETLDVLLNHRMHVNTRLQLHPEVRAACARALWNPFRLCVFVSWSRGIINPLKLSETTKDSSRY